MVVFHVPQSITQEVDILHTNSFVHTSSEREREGEGERGVCNWWKLWPYISSVDIVVMPILTQCSLPSAITA